MTVPSGNPAMPPSGLPMRFASPQLAKNFAWAGGHYVISKFSLLRLIRLFRSCWKLDSVDRSDSIGVGTWGRGSGPPDFFV